MKRIQTYVIILYLCFLTTALAGSILTFEITNSFIQFYTNTVRFFSLGIEILLILLISKYVVVKKIHQKMKEIKEMIT